MKKAQAIPFGTAQAVQPPEQIQEQIRQRAHEIYEARGREHGHDLDDWLIAESEVTSFHCAGLDGEAKQAKSHRANLT